MDLKEIESLWDRFERSAASEMSLKQDGFEFTLKKNSQFENKEEAPALKIRKGQSEPSAEDENTADRMVIKAPLAGTFYRASSPEAEPFVKVGSTVAKDQVVCIIEAMKMINEIRSPFDGIVSSIAVNNGQLAGFDQPLIYLEKANV